MKSTIKSLTECANCGACLNACPMNAIYINDQNTFYQMEIDDSRCIKCGRCVEVCPLQKELEPVEVKGAWWGKHISKEELKSSSSGGAFSGLAKNVLNKNGVVFGASFSDDYKSVQLCSTDYVSVERLKRSKYVESLVGLSFREAEKELKVGRSVLFCGTPCQIAGLKTYLGREYSNLLTCDFACGGTPSHGIYSSYLDELELRYKSKVAFVDFRSKTFGWSTHAICIRFQNGKRYIMPASLDPFFRGFIHERVNMREHCYSCAFSDHHASDLTLADFWKYRAFIPDGKDDKGLSLLLANSAKGIAAIDELVSIMELNVLPVDMGAYNNTPRLSSRDELNDRREYLGLCEREGFREGSKCLHIPKGVKAFVIKLKCVLKGVHYRIQ